MGPKYAAQRKALQELGIQSENCKIKDIQYLTRILYSADSTPKWSEHELDYILLLKSQQKTIEMDPNPEEVQNVMFLKKSDLNDFIRQNGEEKFTPWFLLMSRNLLPKWWSNLDNLQPFVDHENITRFY